MKKIVVIQDLSSLGKCSLTAAIPVLSVMGAQACPLPTAILSAQTAFPSYHLNDLTADMPRYMEEWRKMEVSFDGIQTGYVTGEKQIAHIFQFLNEFYTKNTKLLVDPVLGDDGELYKMFSNKLLSEMKELAKLADIITPNITECCLLAGKSYEKIYSYSDEASFSQAVIEAGQTLQQQVGRKVIVTGITSESSKLVANLYVDNEGVHMSKNFYNGKSYSGTGDLFASVIMGAMMRGQSVKVGMELAEKFLQIAIQTTDKLNTSTLEGVHFERHLNLLL